MSLESTKGTTGVANTTHEEEQTLPVVFIVRVDHGDTSYFFLKASIAFHTSNKCMKVFVSHIQCKYILQ